MTTQNDLVVAALAATAAFFVLGRTRADVALAGLALGLALGTKLTVALALPALALLALAAGGARRLAWAAGATAAAPLLVGSYGYALNLIHTGSPARRRGREHDAPAGAHVRRHGLHGRPRRLQADRPVRLPRRPSPRGGR